MPSFCLPKCVLTLVRASLVFTRFISLVLSQCPKFVGGGRGGAAIKPDLRARTADGNWIK